MLFLIAAALSGFTFLVHTLVGQRRVVGPMLSGQEDPFARGVILVVWHMVTWTLALVSVGLMIAVWEPTPVLGYGLAILCAGFAAIFLGVSQRMMGAAIRLPQWILFGAVAVLTLAATLGRAQLFVVPALLAIAAVHVAWAFGSSWPEKNGKALGLAIIGRVVVPGRAACLAVAVALVAMAAAVLMPSPHWLKVGIAAIFIARGTLGFIEPALRKEIRGTPYALYSRFMFTPLSLTIGAATLLVS